MKFQNRLKRAIERGRQRSDDLSRADARKALSDEELRRLHSQYRLELSEQIETCLRQLAEQFPGFDFENVVSDQGWGAGVSRDDVEFTGRRRDNAFSRLQMLIRPISSSHVVELAAKGTIRNKELFNRTHYQRLEEADPTTFAEMIDLWVLEYAEQYSAGE